MSGSVAMWAGNSPPPLLHLTARCCWASLTILLYILLSFLPLPLLLVLLLLPLITIFLTIIIMSPQLHSSPP